jgi:hypothetical protein
MNAPLSAQTHYLTSFRLKATPALKEPLSVAAAKVIRRWVGRKERTTEGLLGQWFFSKGTWGVRASLFTFVRVDSEAGVRDDKSPEFWALHYRHADGDLSKHRFWYSDVGLRAVSDDEVVFGCRVSHAIEHDFIGVAPPAPSPSAPGLVDDMFQSPHWTIHSAGSILQREPIEVVLGKGEALVNTIFDSTRILPIVMVNGQFNSREFPVAPAQLQKLLLGSAVVCWSDYNPELAEELNYYLHDDYRCEYRMIRVFMPGANKSDPNDFRRHRFFSFNAIRELSVPVVIEAIVGGLARRARISDRDAITSIADIEHVVRERRLERYRSEGTPNAEWIALLEAENKRIAEESKAAALLLDEADATNHRLEFEVESLKSNLQSLKASKAGSESITQEDREALAKIMTLPNAEARPVHCLRALTIIYPDRVRVLATAIASAEDAESFQFVNELWDLLRKLAGDYYLLLKKGGVGDAAARSVFGRNEYAAKESETVATSPRLLSHRKFQDGDKTRVMLRHLKIGAKDSKAETIRVHFDWVADEKRVVIGHCGPHLPLS